jgi:hypothetical protein
MDRNIALLENKMTIEWKRTLNGSSHSSLQARGWSSVGSHIAKAVKSVKPKAKWFKALNRNSRSFRALKPKAKWFKALNRNSRSFKAVANALKPQFLTKVLLFTATAIPLGFGMVQVLKLAFSKYGEFTDQNSFRYRMGKKVLTDDVNVYCKNKVLTVVIWYGNWEKSYAGIETMEYLAGHIGDSNWYSPMRDYYFQKSETSPKEYVKGAVHFKESYYDNYSSGKSLGPFKVSQIIKHQLNGSLPDPNGLYFVIGSSDVAEKRDDEACGWHTYTNDLASYPTYFSYLTVIFIIFNF